MLRRLVLAPALAALALGTAAAPADAYPVICLDLRDLEIIIVPEFEFPKEIPVFPNYVCVPWLLPFPPPAP